MKSFIVLVFMIFTLVGLAKADGWTNTGEFSYLYPNGTKQITDYTLTEDGKSIVVVTAEGNNTYRINKLNLESGIVEFDSLLITTENHRFVLSTDGLTAFEVEQHPQYNGYIGAYKLFDIYHSSRGYLYKDTLINDDHQWPYSMVSFSFSFLNFLFKDNLIYLGAQYGDRSEYPNDENSTSYTSSGLFNVFDIAKPKSPYEKSGSGTTVYDYYRGMKIFLFNQEYSYSSKTSSESTSSLVMVDSTKKETLLFKNACYNNPKFLKLYHDSLLAIEIKNPNDYTIHYYDINLKTFIGKYIFPKLKNKYGFYIGFSNDGKQFLKSDNNILQFYKTLFNYPICELNLPDSIVNIENYQFSKDDKYIITINNSKQIIRIENPTKGDALKALFTISDSILIAKRAYKCFNFSAGNPNSYSWDFGNGATSNDSQPEINYENPGKYIIKLTIEKAGQSSSQEKVVEVIPFFEANFDIVSIPENIPIICKLKNTSIGNIDSLVWDFGDGTYSKSKDIDIDHQFAKESEYNVKLKVYYNKFKDSIEKKVSINNIKETPLEPTIYSEYNFENTSQNHQKFYKVYETKDNGFIIAGLQKQNVVVHKANSDFQLNNSIVLNIPMSFDPRTGAKPLNINEIYYNNSLQLNDNSFLFSYFVPHYYSSMVNFDASLNKITSIDSLNGNVLSIEHPITLSNDEFWAINNYVGVALITKFNLKTKEKKVFNPSGDFISLYIGQEALNKFYAYHYAFTPISNEYSFYAFYNVTSAIDSKTTFNVTRYDQSVKLIKKIPFQTFRNIDTTTFVGLDTLGNIYKFNANGDSLNKISLTPGLRNISVNGSLYYAVGFKDNHPICYAFDNDLKMKDTIYIEQRDGAFLDALICKSGDLVLAGYKYIPSKTDTVGKLLRSSYILKINKYTTPIDTTKENPKDTTKVIPIPISITNPIDHLATIRFAVDSSTTFHYEAYDFLGNLVFKTAEEKIENEYTGTVDFSGLAPGVYIFKFYINGKIETKKVIYQK